MPEAAALIDATPRVDWLVVFEERCDARAYLVTAGQMRLHEAVDGLQADAVSTGLVAQIGQDAVQMIMARHFGEQPNG